MKKPAPNIKLLNEIRLRCLTQKELAEKSGVSEAYVSRIINGRMIPDANQCKAIAKALRVAEERVFS